MEIPLDRDFISKISCLICGDFRPNPTVGGYRSGLSQIDIRTKDEASVQTKGAFLGSGLAYLLLPGVLHYVD
jgi:hypothetical protein